MRKPLRKHVAFTLVELLVALTIASVLTLIALPTVKESLRQNSLIRSASLLRGAFINARSQAARTGRPFGVVIERQRHNIGAGDPNQLNFFAANYSSRIYYVQSPIAYRGDIEQAFAYPFFDTSEGTIAAGGRPNKFFVPQSSAGLLYAAVNGGAASRLVNIGAEITVNGRTSRITGMATSATGIAGISNPAIPPAPPAGPPLGATLRSSGTIITTTDSAGTHPSSPPANALLNLQPYEFTVRTLPIRAPLAPVSLLGKSTVDLSISGPADAPLAFGTQAIVGSGTVPNNFQFGDVVVMFAPDGRLDGIYLDQPDASSATGYSIQRIDAARTVSFNVGSVDGVLLNVDDGARYPEHVPGTVFPSGATDAPLASPAPPAPLQVTKVPNFANSNSAWVSIQPLSGAVMVSPVAGQPNLADFQSYYGFQSPATPAARTVVTSRVLQSRRLASFGTVQ